MLSRLYARMMGFNWLRCPVCGRMFGTQKGVGGFLWEGSEKFRYPIATCRNCHPKGIVMPLLDLSKLEVRAEVTKFRVTLTCPACRKGDLRHTEGDAHRCTECGHTRDIPGHRYPETREEVTGSQFS